MPYLGSPCDLVSNPVSEYVTYRSFPSHALFLLLLAAVPGLQSVSALLEKFKKSDQVFNVNADVEDEPEDCADAPVMDDFDVDLLDKTMAGDLGKFAQDPEAFRMAHEGTK